MFVNCVSIAKFIDYISNNFLALAEYFYGMPLSSFFVLLRGGVHACAIPLEYCRWYCLHYRVAARGVA